MEGVPIVRLASWFLASRILLWLLAWLSLEVVPPGIFQIHHEFLHWLARWDAGWYLSIATEGYKYHPHTQSGVAFFPLYPALIHLLSFVVPNFYVAGYLLSNGCLFGCTLILWKLVASENTNQAIADRAVLFLLACPVTVFYSSIYTESLFLFLVLAAAFFSKERRWLAAGACGYFAGLTRSPGFLVAILIAVEFATCFLSARGGKNPITRTEALRALVAMALPATGILTYAIYLHFKFDDMLAFLHAQANWDRRLTAPWNLYDIVSHSDPHTKVWSSWALFFCFTLTLLGFCYRLRLSYLAITIAFLLLYCSTSTLESTPRLLSAVFPFYIIEAEIATRWPRLKYGLFIASVLLAIISIVLFVDGYWFT